MPQKNTCIRGTRQSRHTDCKGCKERSSIRRKSVLVERDKGNIELLQHLAIKILEQRSTLENAHSEAEEAWDEDTGDKPSDIKRAHVQTQCNISKSTPD